MQLRSGIRGSTLPLGVNLAVALLLSGVSQFLVTRRPGFYVYLALEDGPIECLSFLGWILAAVLFLWTCKRSSGLRSIVYLGFALIAVVLAMEEISWGQRVFGWGSPAFFALENRQSETNLHNLFPVGTIYRPAAILLIVSCLIPWAVTRVSSRTRSCWNRWSLPVIEPRLWPLFFSSAYFLTRQFTARGHEVGELLLVAAVAVFALDSWMTSERPEQSDLRLASAPLIVLASLLVGILATVWISPTLSDERIARRLNSMANARLGKARLDKAEPLFEFLRRHPRYRLSSTGFYYGMLLQAKGQREQARAILSDFIDQNPSNRQQVESKIWDESLGQRSLGFARCVAGASDLARPHFEAAVEIDRARLAAAIGTPEEASARSSLSASLLAVGESRAAGYQHRRALEMSPSSSMRHRIRNQNKLTKKLAKLAACG